MNKAIIIYSSVYGTTKKYAQWIADELNGDIYDVKDAKKLQLSAYDTIIIGGGLYAGSIKGLDLFIKNFETIKNKKLIIYTCGLADYSKTVNIDSIYKRIANVIPNNILECIQIFYLRGGINYKELGIKHKFMMGMLRKMTLKKGENNLNDEDKMFIETYGKTLDFMEKKNIQPIIDYCK